MKKVLFTMILATTLGACTTSQSTQTTATKAVPTKQLATESKPNEPQNEPMPKQESRYKKAPNGAVKSLPMESAPIEVIKIDSL